MKTNTRKIAAAGLIAACYTVLTVALAPISYGMVQVRVSEALTLLPVYSPVAIWGVSVGCLISNIIGVAMGTNIIGALDVVFGTIATFLAAILSYKLRAVRLRGLPVLSALPPILLNAVVIGLELCYAATKGFHWNMFLFEAFWVGFGQLVSCLGFGMMLCYVLQRGGLDKKLFDPLA